MFRGNCCADAAAGDGGDDDAGADVFHSRSTVPVSCAFVYYGCVCHVQSGEFRFANYNLFAFHVYMYGSCVFCSISGCSLYCWRCRSHEPLTHCSQRLRAHVFPGKISVADEGWGIGCVVPAACAIGMKKL